MWFVCFLFHSSVSLVPVDDQYVKQQGYMTVTVHLLRKNVNYAVPMILMSQHSVDLLQSTPGSQSRILMQLNGWNLVSLCIKCDKPTLNVQRVNILFNHHKFSSTNCFLSFLKSVIKLNVFLDKIIELYFISVLFQL